MTWARGAYSARIFRLRVRRCKSARSSAVTFSAIWRGSIPLSIQWLQATSPPQESEGPDVPRPIRVLHLEDSPRDAEIIRHKLEVDGVRCDIVLANSKDSFEAALVQESFDLILSDYNLPDFDGTSAIKRAQEQQPDTPVIVISR